MNTKEITYLDKFRELHRLKGSIDAMIGEFRAVCESLKAWQKTAAELATLNQRSRPEWSEERFKGLLTLRGAMLEYHNLKEQVKKMWNDLGSDCDKVGLPDPGSLEG